MVMIDWSGTEYRTALLNHPALVLEEFEQKSEGFGGVFGFGEKGSQGWTLRLTDDGAEVTNVVLLPYITSFVDLMAKDDRFLYGKRKPRAIPFLRSAHAPDRRRRPCMTRGGNIRGAAMRHNFRILPSAITPVGPAAGSSAPASPHWYENHSAHAHRID